MCELSLYLLKSCRLYGFRFPWRSNSTRTRTAATTATVIIDNLLSGERYLLKIDRYLIDQDIPYLYKIKRFITLF
jgi:hypothetical protein